LFRSKYTRILGIIIIIIMIFLVTDRVPKII